MRNVCTKWAFQGLFHKNQDNASHTAIAFFSLKTIEKHKIAAKNSDLYHSLKRMKHKSYYDAGT